MNMGSMTALYPMAKRQQELEAADWEESYLLNSDGYIFPNTFRDIEKVYKTLGEGHGVVWLPNVADTQIWGMDLCKAPMIAACSSRRSFCS